MAFNTVGSWNAATKYTGPKGWAYAAKGVVVFQLGLFALVVLLFFMVDV